jgi:WD40 repeat protein
MIFGMNRWVSAVIAVIVVMALVILSVPPVGRTAEPVAALQANASFESVAFAPNAKILACDLALRDVASGKVLGTGDLGENLPPCTCVAFSPDGQRLASVHFSRGLIGPPHALCLWNITADNQVHHAATLLHAKEQPHLYEESLHYLTFSPDGRMLATRLPGDRTVVWETASGKERLRLDTHGLAVAFASDGQTLTSVNRTGLVQHWNLATGKCADAADGARREDFLFVCNAVASADGKTLALSDHHSVLLKEARTGKTLRRFDDLAAECLALSPDGKTLAVVDGGVLLLDAATGKETGQLGKRKQSVHALAFSPDGKSLAVGLEKAVEVWEVADLARAGKPGPAHDPAPPLEAKVAFRKGTYPLALGGKTAEDFARQFDVEKPLPASPEVDLILTVRNTSNKKLTLDPKGEFESYLVGAGALNHPELPYQTGIGRGGFSQEPKQITLAPGESYSVPIKSLDHGHDQQAYWLLPGEYTLHVSYHTRVTPAPEGWNKGVDGTGYGTLRAAPLRLKVVAATK